MGRFVLLVCALIAICAPVKAQGNGPVILFWNLENYFDPFDDPATADDDFTPVGAKHWTWKKFILKRNGIAKTIVSAGDEFGRIPDIVGFAEVENRMVLRQLVAETPLEKLEYGIVHRNSPDRRGIDVALIYRKSSVRILKVDSLRTDCQPPTRDILYVKAVWLPGDTLHLFVNHWPSKLGGAEASSARRKAVADVLNRAVDSVTAHCPKQTIIAMGDFNDTPDNTDKFVTSSLHNLSDILFVAGFGTIKYQGEWELIDQIFVNAEGWKMSIYSPDFLLEEDKAYMGRKPRRTYLGPRHNGGLSDHLPIACVRKDP